MSEGLFNVDDLLSSTLKNESLAELFEKKLDELKLKQTNVLEIFGIPYRTLKGILEGTQKTVDVRNFIKLADFLQLPKERVFQLYIDTIQQKSPSINVSADIVRFVKKNFDLTVLKKAGVIDNVNDYQHIVDRIKKRLGYKSIYEYKIPEIDVAFSTGLFKPANILTRSFWIRSAMNIIEEIGNPYNYSREALITYFPQIRWHTLKEKQGLTEVIKALYKLGITVIYQPNLQGLQLRGATFNINGKPAIALTNYRGFYSTLWHCLIHELFHVLFDWEEIKNHCYHLTDDDVEELTVKEREKDADDFAHKYLFSPEKLAYINPRIKDELYVKEFANENHIHYSIIYAFNAFQNKEDKKAWARVRKISPPVSNTIKDVDFPWDSKTSMGDYVNVIKSSIYN